MKKFPFICFLSLLITHYSFSQSVEVYPSHWWVGMKWNKVQLMLHGKNISNLLGKYFVEYKNRGVHLLKVNRVENPNYVFIDIKIDDTAKPGKFPLEFVWPNDGGGPDETISIPFELKPRRPGKGTAFAQGVTSKDFVYLLMPDRFSNGDTTNDRIAGMKDQSLDRSDFFARHGGDLQGVINHLDYLKDHEKISFYLVPLITHYSLLILSICRSLSFQLVGRNEME